LYSHVKGISDNVNIYLETLFFPFISENSINNEKKLKRTYAININRHYYTHKHALRIHFVFGFDNLPKQGRFKWANIRLWST